MSQTPLLQLRDVAAGYQTPAGHRPVLAEVDLAVGPGELVVVRGPSGAGKTTLLSLVVGVLAPTRGNVQVAGRDLAEVDEAALAAIRSHELGYVPQTFGLLQVLTAAENVEVPLRLLGVEVTERRERVRGVLASVGLERHVLQRPTELSGGQQQRVAVARALVSRAPLLVADEPTAQLDSATARSVMDVIVGRVARDGLGALVATHDRVVMDRADRLLTLREGRLVAET